MMTRPWDRLLLQLRPAPSRAHHPSIRSTKCGGDRDPTYLPKVTLPFSVLLLTSRWQDRYLEYVSQQQLILPIEAYLDSGLYNYTSSNASFGLREPERVAILEAWSFRDGGGEEEEEEEEERIPSIFLFVLRCTNVRYKGKG